MKSAISSIFRKIKHFAEIRENLLFLAILAVGIVGVIKNTKHDNFSSECEDNRATLECIRPVASKKPLAFAKSIKKTIKNALFFRKIQLSAKYEFAKSKARVKKIATSRKRSQIF